MTGNAPSLDKPKTEITANVSLSANNVHKSFGGVKALDGVGITLKKGEIHALVGANGAGKSTLARIVAGHLRPDRADLAIAGAPVQITSPRDALQQGVAMVTQQLSLANDLSVAENIMLAELAKPGFLNRRRLRQTAAEMLNSVNPAGDIDVSARAGSLSSAHRQMVEIAKAMSQNPQVIIFDEPTTSLTPFETERLFEVMESLAAAGKALVFVSHRLEEIFTICRVATVLRDGKNVCAALPVATLDQARLIQLIIGRELDRNIYGTNPKGQPAGLADPSHATGAEAEVVLEVKHLAAPPKVRDVSFQLRRGEILGLAGLVGAGRSETARLIFGLDQPESGEIRLNGRLHRHISPRQSYRRRLAMIPEDRKAQGAIPDFTVRENIMVSHSAANARLGTGYARLQAAVLDLIRELKLEPRNLQKLILQLSGGMQQKAMLSRALLIEPEILVLDEPTQGVDIGTRSDIYAILRGLAARGLSMLFISSDFEEVLGVSDRVVVLSEGRSVATFAAGLMDEEKLTMFAAPRTSARSTSHLLRALEKRWPEAVGYWVYFGQGRVYCFDGPDSRAELPLGFKRGEMPIQADTCLAPFPLTGDGTGVAAAEADRVGVCRGLHSVVIPRLNARGQRLGYIGLTLPAAAAGAFDPKEFAEMVGKWE